jgi:uncharacterized protein (DUF1330 family)
MSAVNTNPDALKAMAAGNPDEPVWMLNLLRYRDRAQSGFGVDGLSGEAAYRVYGEKFAALNPRFGGQPVWLGEAHHTIIGEESWDIIILVHYPTRKQFTDMLQDPDYQAIAPIRAAALADSRLIESSQLLPKLNI